MTMKTKQKSCIAKGLGFIAAFLLSLSTSAWAQNEATQMRKIRTIDTSDYFDRVDTAEALNAAGTAFPPWAGTLLKLDQLTLGAVTLEFLTSGRRPGHPGNETLAVSSAFNIAFDGKLNNQRAAGRFGLFTLDNATGELLALTPDNQGSSVAVTRFDSQLLGVTQSRGMAFDPINGHLFLLHSDGTGISRVVPGLGPALAAAAASNGRVFKPLSDRIAATDLRGLALNPSNRHLYTVSPQAQTLYELTQQGKLVNSYRFADVDLTELKGMVFAPSGDRTDDPARMSLFLLTSNGSAGSVSEWTFAGRSKAASLGTIPGTLIQTIDTSQFVPPSPDPAGISYRSDTDTLLISDSEVNEMPIFAGVNLFDTDRFGLLLDGIDLTPVSNEPTGVAYNPVNDHLFISDDDEDMVFEINPGNDGLYGTADDSISSFDTRTFDSFDPEGIAYDSALNAIFISDGVNSEIYQVTPGGNGIFDGLPPAGDDQVANFDSESQGISDPEGITWDADNGYLYVVGEPRNRVAHFTSVGTLIRLIDISAANARAPAGLSYAPSSQNPSVMNLYITARGVDNDTDPNENDGKVYEFSLPALPGGNQMPGVSAGPDQEVILPNDVILNGAITDDGLPNPPATLISTWNQLSGPGIVTFADASAAATPASFSAAGVYLLRLTADDSVLTNSDDVTINILDPLPPAASIYLSTSGSASAGGISFRDEDIALYDVINDSWSLHFDGSDVGLNGSGVDIDAFHINTDGSILLSLADPTTLPDVGVVDSADIVRFIPTSTGNNTAGSFEWYFDGSDVDLTTSSENIDAINLNSAGHLLISTSGSFNVTGASGKDEDLALFTATSLGETTSGSWQRYFDGSDVGLNQSSEDVYGVWSSTSGDIYLTTKRAFSVPYASGDEADIFACVPSSTGDDTSCAFTLFWDGSAHGLGGERVDGFHIVH